MNTELYNRAYQDPTYNPKEAMKIKWVREWVEEQDLKTVLDVGCGRGHYLKEITFADGLEPSTYLCENELKDFNVINSDIQSLKTDKKWDGLYCMDVLEHIDPSEIEAVVEKLSKLAPKAMYGIANHSDPFNGVELHLIQEDVHWWRTLLSKYYKDVRLTYEPDRYFVLECYV